MRHVLREATAGPGGSSEAGTAVCSQRAAAGNFTMAVVWDSTRDESRLPAEINHIWKKFQRADSKLNITLESTISEAQLGDSLELPFRSPSPPSL